MEGGVGKKEVAVVEVLVASEVQTVAFHQQVSLAQLPGELGLAPWEMAHF